MKRFTVLTALAVLSVGASAATGEALVHICESKDSLVISASNKKGTKELGEAFAALPQDKPPCAAVGPHQGVWVLDGTKSAVQVGVIPVGESAQPHLLVQKPRYRLIPLLVERVKTN